MLADGIKVVVLDITGRYGDQFADICSTATEDRISERIEDAIAANEGNRNVRDDEAGNLRDFETALNNLLTEFVRGDERLMILNPNRFVVTRMEGKPFNQQANFMVRLTMVEITRIIAEQLLRLLQARPRDPRAENAELCLVLEEAHSLVPEWNSTANDAEQQATTRHGSCSSAGAQVRVWLPPDHSTNRERDQEHPESVQHDLWNADLRRDGNGLSRELRGANVCSSPRVAARTSKRSSSGARRPATHRSSST